MFYSNVHNILCHIAFFGQNDKIIQKLNKKSFGLKNHYFAYFDADLK